MLRPASPACLSLLRGPSAFPDGVGACGPPPTEPECRPGVRLAYGKVSRHHLIPVIEPACIPVIEPACGAAGSSARPVPGPALARAPVRGGPVRWARGRGAVDSRCAGLVPREGARTA